MIFKGLQHDFFILFRCFFAFFFAISKTIPIFVVFYIFRNEAGDVRQLFAGFFYARTIHI